MLTEKGDFFVLHLDCEGRRGELITLVHANVNSVDCMPTRTSHFMTIDSANHVILIHVSIGVLQIIGYEVRGGEVHFKKAHSLRVMELEIQDVTFIDSVRAGSTLPTIAVLHRLPMKLPQIRTYEMLTEGGTLALKATSYSMTELSSDVHRILRVPAPRGGFLVVAPERIVYTNPLDNVLRKLVFPPMYVVAASCIDSDGFRFLLGSSAGDLYILLLLAGGAEGRVTELRCEKLGQTSIASCLSYIDDGHVYVGSQHGDSQLIQLSAERIGSSPSDPQFLRVVETFPSLAPMTDVCVLQTGSLSDQSVLVAASGSAKDGALKVITSGLDAATVLIADLEGETSPTAIFSHRPDVATDHTHMICSSLGQTTAYVVDVAGGQLKETSLGLNPETETLDIVPLSSGELAQITARGVSLNSMKGARGTVIWECKAEERVILATHQDSLLLLATSDRTLWLLDVSGAGCAILCVASFECEASCVSLCRLKDGSWMGLVGFWDIKSFGFLFPDETKKLRFVRVDGQAVKSVIRSVRALDAGTEGRLALFGTGDGQLIGCWIPVTAADAVNAPSPTVATVVRLGRSPVTLHASDCTTHVIGQCDQPLHISWHHGKLLCSTINMPSFATLAQFSLGGNAGFACVTGGEIRLMQLQQSFIPRVHIRTVPVGRSIHKLVHLPQAGLIAAILHNFPVMIVPMSHWPLLRSELVLFHEHTLEIVDRYTLQPDGNTGDESVEIGWCLAAGRLDGLEGESLAVGTGLGADDPKAERGRLLIFQMGEGMRLRLVSSNETNGGVKAVSMCGGFVVACVRGLNVVYKWDYRQERRLLKASSSGGHIDGTSISQLDNILAIGDSLTSVSFCHLNRTTLKITEIARDFQDNYVTAVQLVDHGSAVASDLTGNLLTMQVVREEQLEMNAAICGGNIHLGDMVNAIIPGTLRVCPEASLKSLLLVSAAGAIYSMHHISSELYRKLLLLQKNLVAMIKPVGGIKHAEFRRFFNGERKMKSASGFIDGDLLTRFLSLTPQQREEALGRSKSSGAEQTALTAAEATRLIESLSYGV